MLCGIFRGLAHVRWVKHVLLENTAFLASNPENESLLFPLTVMREVSESISVD
jgi:hypothetical protein